MSEFRTQVELRWGDMDLNGHVNNATTLTLLEEGRVRLLYQAGQGLVGADIGLVVARHEIDYVRPMYYSTTPATVIVWIERIGRSSFTFGCDIEQNGEVAVRAQTVVVAITPDGSRSVPLPDDARAVLETYRRDTPPS